MENKTQNDIVNQHLQSLQVGEVLEDKLKMPRLDKVFKIVHADKAQQQRERIRLPLSGKAIGTSRNEISAAITQVLEFRKDAVGISWNVGEDYVELLREPGTVVEFSKDVTEDDIIAVLMTVLRSRVLLRKFAWDFEKPHVLVTYENI